MTCLCINFLFSSIVLFFFIDNWLLSKFLLTFLCYCYHWHFAQNEFFYFIHRFLVKGKSGEVAMGLIVLEGARR